MDSSNYSSLKASFSCGFTGHDYKISHKINDHVEEYSRCKCGKQMTTTIYGDLVPLTATYSRINKALRQLALKKNLGQLETTG